MKPLTYDFGNFGADDISRVKTELEEFAQIKRDPLMTTVAQMIADEFLVFVIEVFNLLGHMGTDQMVKAHMPVMISPKEGDTPAQILRQLWDKRSGLWGLVESPFNYLITMQTLIENLELTEQNQRREMFLSIGTGPGLYEVFLANTVRKIQNGKRVRFICTDFAYGMLKQLQELLVKSGELQSLRGSISYMLPSFGHTCLTTVLPAVSDMNCLSIRSKTIDQIICNNSLQWSENWKRAIAEMARVIKPNGIGNLYLFVHLHPMSLIGPNGERFLKLGNFSSDELFDELEANGFEVKKIRQIAGKKGTGQYGMEINRLFVKARFNRNGIKKPWREKQVSASFSGALASERKGG
jgi:SAM-dependent methyltransferase